MKFKGKVAAWYWALLLIANGMAFLNLDYLKGRETELAIYIIIADFVLLPPVIQNYVFLTKDTLTVCFGFGKDEIKIRDIVEVRETRNPIAAGAASMDRIVIKDKQKEIMCAVKEKEEFYEELKRRRRKIVIIRREKKKKDKKAKAAK